MPPFLSEAVEASSFYFLENWKDNHEERDYDKKRKENRTDRELNYRRVQMGFTRAIYLWSNKWREREEISKIKQRADEF